MQHLSTVLVVDYGSQYTQLIARRVREAGVYAEILPWSASDDEFKGVNPSAIILSGGPADVGERGSPHLNPVLLQFDVPLLGICYGMQLLAHTFEGTLANGKDREYGPAELKIVGNCPLWKGVSRDPFTVWMSHGNRVVSLPNGFETIGTTASVDLAAMANKKRSIYALQFHPEVHHSTYGKKILQNFLFEVARLLPNWNAKSFLDSAIAECREKARSEDVLLALSGGVDSTVVAAILHRAIGKRLHCIFVDHGFLRQNEADEVIAAFRRHMPGLDLLSVDAKDLFLSRLAGVENPEDKRKIIGHTFIEIFERESKKFPNVKFLSQGTVYPDVIESRTSTGMVIKSHHNVGGLPATMRLELIEPLRNLFKDEVRSAGLEIGLSEEIVWRHPFPGPGLAVRILGEVTNSRLAILRAADKIVEEELQKSEWFRRIWQGFAVLLPLRTVGVMGDVRTYENVIALRVVDSVDAMTADWTRLPHDLIATVSTRIVSEVRGVNRVVYDVSSKPPSTIEWE
jgi:GMP synthase (glutamine-hydrolysing)